MASGSVVALTQLKSFLIAEGTAGRLTPAPGYVGELPPDKARVRYPMLTVRYTGIEEDGGSEQAEASLSVTVCMLAGNPETCHSEIVEYANSVRKAIKRKGNKYGAGIKSVKWKGTRFNAVRGSDTATVEIAELEFDCEIRQEDQQP